MTQEVIDTPHRTAIISADGLYRYRLDRRWSDAPPALFVMLNPSTADDRVDDRTIVRCVRYARSWDLGGLVVVNLYAYRATNPRRLWDADDPIGPGNDHHLRAAAVEAAAVGSPLVAAWGAHARPDRVAEVLSLPGMGQLQALGVTNDGQPRHPLYTRADAQLVPWSPGGAT